MLGITFFGTGSSIPQIHKGQSCLSIQKNGRIYLVDIGEGSQFRLMRSSISIMKIEGIFLTHQHGDHINGLLGFVETLQQYERSTALTIYGSFETIQKARRIIEVSSYRNAYPIVYQVISLNDMIDLPDLVVSCVATKHIQGSLGFLFHEKEGKGIFDIKKVQSIGIPPGPLYKKLHEGEDVTWNGQVVRSLDVVGKPRPGVRVFCSGDTKFHPSIYQNLHDIDVMIHEATYRSHDRELANKKNHSTASDAANAALISQSKLLVLTHLSPRTRKNEIVKKIDGYVLNEAKTLFRNTIVVSPFQTLEVSKSEVRGISEVTKKEFVIHLDE